MAIHDFRQSFNSGELSPLMDSRVSVEKYQSGCAVLENFIPHVHGPISKRAGSVDLAAQANTGTAARLIGWNFANGEYAVAEFSQSQVRFWTGAATVTTVTSSTYLASQADGIKFAHVNNIVWLAHPDKPVQRITRTPATPPTWAIAEVEWTYPPLLDENVTTTTLGLSSASVGAGVTLTASAAYFLGTASDIGTYFEIAHPRTTSYVDTLMGDGSTFASVTLTITGAAANGEQFTIGTSGSATIRTYTIVTNGRDAADEIEAGTATVLLADNIVETINLGGGGADPHGEVTAEVIGGIKASNTFGITSANTNFADGDIVSIKDWTVRFDDGLTLSANEVNLGATLQESLENLMHCMNHTGIAGTDGTLAAHQYGPDTIACPYAEGVSVTTVGSGRLLTVQARTAGPEGNLVTTTETTSGTQAWTTATLTGGTSVVKIKARLPGTVGNAITSIEVGGGVSNFAFSATALAGGTNESATTSSSIVVYGSVEVRTTGLWDGSLTLQRERSTGPSVWEAVRVWNSKFDDATNVNETINFTTRETLRLVFSGTGLQIATVWPRAVITPLDPYVRGLVKVTGFTSTTVCTVTVLIACQEVTATPIWSEGAWSIRRGYPRAVCFHQNRLWYGGTTYEPAKLWASALGDYENFRITTLDDGAMAFQIAASQSQQILWMAVTHTLVIGTTFGVWVGETADSQIAFTNTSPPQFRQKSAVPSADYQPAMLQEALIYVVAGGRQLRKITYDTGVVFTSTLLTVLADHITGLGVGNLSAQSNPDSIVWMETSSGVLVGMSLDMEQNVFAWHRHPMSGALVESSAVVRGSSGDEVWLSVFRGSSRRIERLEPGTHQRLPTYLSAPQLLCHVDGAVFDNTAGTAVSGLAHLTSVQAWSMASDVYRTQPAMSGTSQGTYTVVAGAITLGVSATTAWVGAPMVSVMTIMKPDFPMRDGSARDRVMQIKKVTLHVYLSSDGVLVFEGDTFSGVTSALVSISGTAAPRTRQATANLVCRHREDGQVSIRHVGAGPFTLSGIVVQLDIGGSAVHHPPGSTS